MFTAMEDFKTISEYEILNLADCYLLDLISKYQDKNELFKKENGRDNGLIQIRLNKLNKQQAEIRERILEIESKK